MVDSLADIVDLQNLEFVAAHVTEGFMTGLHKSPFHGFSSEFDEHRLYNKGESTRHIDWKLYARTDKLFVKRYEEETNLRCYIIIDTSSSMKYPIGAKTNKLAFSAVCAAAIINLLRKQRDAVALATFDQTQTYCSQAKVSSLHAKMLFSKLNDLLLDKQPKLLEQRYTIADCLHTFAEQIHQRSLVLIFSDMFDWGQDDNLFASLQHLRHCKHDVVLFHVVDSKTELNFNFENRPHRFYDIETGAYIDLNPFEYKNNYKQKSNTFVDKLRTHCGMYDMDYVCADIGGSFKQVLVPYLVRRSTIY